MYHTTRRAALAFIAVAAFFALAFFTGGALAQQGTTPPVGPDWSKITVKTTDLGHATYMLEGQGGNVTVAVGEDGVIMVDGQFAPMHDKLKAAIAAVTSEPVKFLINTHHHGDHSGGNAAFAADGATVVGHVNERGILANGSVSNNTMAKIPPVPENALPAKTYTDAMTLEVKGRSAQLRHAANAHTGGDTYVYLADANVLATGDTVTIKRYPNIDFLNGGSIHGVIAAADAYLALTNDATKIVPGHGPLTDKAGVTAYRAMMIEARDRMMKLIADEKTLDEVYALKPYADFDAKLGASEPMAKSFIRVVYSSLKQ